MSDDEASLVYPFVVCQSNGGPYEDQAFVAGVWFGQAMEAIKWTGAWSAYVPSPLVPQFDLLAMNEGLTMTSEPWEDFPDEHTLVTLAAPEAPKETNP